VNCASSPLVSCLMRLPLGAELTSKLKPLSLDGYCSPLFVTWNTVSSRLMGGVRLRGCIGNFEPMSLDEGLKEYALIRYVMSLRLVMLAECTAAQRTSRPSIQTYRRKRTS
jgi:hypothetical protein